MEIIMLKDVAKVGRKHEVVTVSEGYAINFLIPKGFAKAATAGAKKEVALKRDKEGATREADAAHLKEAIKAVDGKSVTLRLKANEQGHLFAALHADTINAAVYDQLGICLSDALFGNTTIKEIGTFPIALDGEGEKAAMTLFVEREG